MSEPRPTGRAAVRMWLIVGAAGCLPIVLFSDSGPLAIAVAALIVIGCLGDLIVSAARRTKGDP